MQNVHPIRGLILRTQPSRIDGMRAIENYVNSPHFFIKKAAEALFSAHFGPSDLRHTNLARAAHFRQKALAAKQGVVTTKFKHISW